MLTQIKHAGLLVFFTILFTGFVLSGLTINAIQLFLWISLKPFSRWLYRKINYYLLYLIWMQATLLMDWSGSKCSVFTDDETWLKMGKENALLILNHSNELDWLVVWILSQQSQILGNSKLFIKKAVEWIPIIGWAWKFGEIGFLERNWEKDKEVMETFFHNLREYTDPVWLLFFPEGTRFTPEKHAVSMEFAKKAGLPHMKFLLTPRTKGFHAVTQQLRGKFDAVYSATLCFDTKMGEHPTLFNMFMKRRVVGDVFLERIPFEDIPTDPDKNAQWLIECFQRKDTAMEMYEKTRLFPTEGRYFTGPVRCQYHSRPLLPLVMYLAWTYFVSRPVLTMMVSGLSTGWVGPLIGLAVLAMAATMMSKLVDITTISKGSDYGCAKQKKTE